jgi:hypothetical protein
VSPGGKSAELDPNPNFKLIIDKHKNICSGIQWNDVSVPA